MSIYQWIGSSNADLGNDGNWANESNPGTPGVPGIDDVGIIQVGQGLYGVLDVDALDIVQASGAPTISITGSSTQVTAASVGIGLGFTLDTGAYLQAGTMGIDGDGTKVTVQNNAFLYDVGSAENDVLAIGADSGTAQVIVTKGGIFAYSSNNASGTLDLGDASNSAATFTVSAGGYFASTLSGFNIGAAAGASGYLNVTGAGSQFLMDNYGYTTIGDFGELGGSAQGTVSVSAGGYASLSSYGEVDIGTSAGMAKVLVTGAGSAIEAGPYVEVGVSTTNIAGEILVQSGGEFDTATDLYVNNGTLAVTGANSLYTGRILTFDQGTTVQVTTGGEIHVADIQRVGILRLTAGDVEVRASYSLYGGSETTGYGTISATTLGNAGQIIASGGTLAVSGSITGTGSAHILKGATLQLAGPAAASQTISFQAGGDTLRLADAAGVAAHITDFAAGDSIDLLGSVATTLSYASGALTIDNGTTQVAKLAIKGSYTTASFKLASDGHGGSLITYVAPNATHPHEGPLPVHFAV